MSDNPLRNYIADWIMQAALSGADMPILLDGVAHRALATGVPLSRVHVMYRTLHPSFESVSLLWTAENGVSGREFGHGSSMSNGWLDSTFHYMIEHQMSFLRRQLVGDDAVIDFPVLQELADDGFTDYLAAIIRFDSTAIDLHEGRTDGIVTSWATDRIGGFSGAHITALQHLVPRLAVACKLAIREQIAANVASTYLGASAGKRVLHGHIRLGDYETINAVVWFADLRDSTGRVERFGMERYLSLLNGFLECAAGAVQHYGGDILSYPGDAVLAIFREVDPCDASKAALAALGAAAECRRRLYDVNANLIEVGLEPLAAGIGLHRGELAYGNIGNGGRQSFTVIGPAANEVQRLEAMTRTEPYSVMMSKPVTGLFPAGMPAFPYLGERTLRGASEPVGVYGANDELLLPYDAPEGYVETVLGLLSAG